MVNDGVRDMCIGMLIMLIIHSNSDIILNYHTHKTEKTIQDEQIL